MKFLLIASAFGLPTLPRFFFDAEFETIDLTTNKPFNFNAELLFPSSATKIRPHDFLDSVRNGADEISIATALTDKDGKVLRYFDLSKFNAKDKNFQVSNIVFPSYVLPDGVDSAKFKFKMIYSNQDCTHWALCIGEIFNPLNSLGIPHTDVYSPLFTIRRATDKEVVVEDKIFLDNGDSASKDADSYLTIYNPGTPYYTAKLYSTEGNKRGFGENSLFFATELISELKLNKSA